MKTRDDLVAIFSSIGIEGMLIDGSLDNLTLSLQPSGYDKLHTNAAATGTVTCDLAAATYFDLTLTGNTTLAFTNVPTPVNQIFSWTVKVTMGGTLRTWAFPAITWYTPGGVAPTAPAVGKTIELVFSTTDGTTIVGRAGPST